MRRTLALLPLLIPAFAAALPIEGSLGDEPRFVLVASGRPMLATLQGQGVELRLHRRLWTVQGDLRGCRVDVFIDHEGKQVVGRSCGRDVRLAFDWSEPKVSYKGSLGGGDVDYTIDWTAGLMSGRAFGKPLRVQFDIAGGTATGELNGRRVDLSFVDPQTGRFVGEINGQLVDVLFENGDISDFLQHFFPVYLSVP